MVNPTRLRILVVDDDAALRMSIISVLELQPDFEEVDWATNGAEAVRLAQELQPDLILMDLEMPIMNGIEATRLIHMQHPAIQILIFSNSTQTQIEAALQAGAVGQIPKTGKVDTMLNEIRRFHLNCQPLAPA